MSKFDLKPISTGDITTMRRLREEGLTNKKIAERMGISVSSVYRHIGRKSQDVKYAEIQNKPIEDEKEEDVVVESSNLLQVVSTRMVLKGSLCNFTVDSESGTIEMSDGVMSGILDRDTVIRFIAELSEASKYIIKEDRN